MASSGPEEVVDPGESVEMTGGVVKVATVGVETPGASRLNGWPRR